MMAATTTESDALLLDVSAGNASALPPGAPPWVIPSLTCGTPLAYLRGVSRAMASKPRAIREACALFPPGALAYCRCSSATCPRWFVIVGVHLHDRPLPEVHLDVLFAPDEPAACRPADLRSLEVLACPAGTPLDVARAWFTGMS